MTRDSWLSRPLGTSELILVGAGGSEQESICTNKVSVKGRPSPSACTNQKCRCPLHHHTHFLIQFWL